jgi:hypothetical protein
MHMKSIIRVSAVGALAGIGLLGASGSAFGAAQKIPTVLFNPVITNPAPVPIPANCPFTNDDFALNFVGGNGNMHDTSNKNGDWGGGNGEGPAVFSDEEGTLYSGHLHVWFGEGNNAKAQTEQGFTLTFHGTGPDGTLDIHANTHQTTNAGGTPTSNIQNITITCS